MADKTKVYVHKAVEPKKLNKAGVGRLALLLSPWGKMDAVLLNKYDGVYSQFRHVSGEWRAFSRTGERQYAAETPSRIARLNHVGDTGRIYIGELWTSGFTHSVINGLSRKKTPQPTLGFVLHDSVRISQLIVYSNKDTTPFIERLKYAARVDQGNIVFKLPHIHKIDIDLAADDAWEQLVDLATLTKNEGRSNDLWYDGLILRSNLQPFEVGSGTAGGIYKIKPRESLDLRITNESVIEQPSKLGGFLTVTYRGVDTDVGSGLTQEMLAAMLYAWKNGEAPVYIGGIAEIEFLEITADGKLREPVFKAIRHDKDGPDV